jgi:ketosteroid isomerase-like protein
MMQQHFSIPLPEEIPADELRRAIEAENLRHIELVRQGDPVAVASQYEDDAIRWFPPMTGITRGREPVVGFWRAIMPVEINEFSLITEDVTLDGDMAAETGRYEIDAITGGGVEIKDAGSYVIVWRRQPDSSWKVWVDIAVSDQPAR